MAWAVTAPLPTPEDETYTLLNISHGYKHGYFRFVPVPVFESDPASGRRYGLMPTFLWFDPKDELITILVTAFTYNPQVVKWGGYGGLFIYPSADETLQIYVQASQNYERDYFIRYDNESWLDGRLDVDTTFEYTRNPFERFFGFGPASAKADESNFVSRVATLQERIAYAVIPHWDVQLEEIWTNVKVEKKALNHLKDTAATYGGLPEVGPSDQWNHVFSLVRDTRDNKDMPSTGDYLKPYGLLSHAPMSGHSFYGGYGLIAKKFFTLAERFTTVAAFKIDQTFGAKVPFYMQPSLGGGFDLRGYLARRFTGRGRLLLDLEERILVKRFNLFDVKFDFTIDPFFSVGQVFDRWAQVHFDNLQPVGGVGFRAKVPTSVVGRVDVGFGKEGPVVFTTLDYPF